MNFSGLYVEQWGAKGFRVYWFFSCVCVCVCKLQFRSLLISSRVYVYLSELNVICKKNQIPELRIYINNWQFSVKCQESNQYNSLIKLLFIKNNNAINCLIRTTSNLNAASPAVLSPFCAVASCLSSLIDFEKSCVTEESK